MASCFITSRSRFRPFKLYYYVIIFLVHVNGGDCVHLLRTVYMLIDIVLYPYGTENGLKP